MEYTWQAWQAMDSVSLMDSMEDTWQAMDSVSLMDSMEDTWQAMRTNGQYGGHMTSYGD
jgi:hypothetical protein